LLDIREDFPRQLVPLLRPATLRQQAGEPFRREGGLCLIRRRQGGFPLRLLIRSFRRRSHGSNARTDHCHGRTCCGFCVQ
jgi:hypothetical protein